MAIIQGRVASTAPGGAGASVNISFREVTSGRYRGARPVVELVDHSVKPSLHSLQVGFAISIAPASFDQVWEWSPQLLGEACIVSRVDDPVLAGNLGCRRPVRGDGDIAPTCETIQVDFVLGKKLEFVHWEAFTGKEAEVIGPHHQREKEDSRPFRLQALALPFVVEFDGEDDQGVREQGISSRADVHPSGWNPESMSADPAPVGAQSLADRNVKRRVRIGHMAEPIKRHPFVHRHGEQSEHLPTVGSDRSRPVPSPIMITSVSAGIFHLSYRYAYDPNLEH
jgi:hypothetical protein